MKPKLLIQKSDLLRRFLKYGDVPAEDMRKFNSIGQIDKYDFVFAEDPADLHREIADAVILITENRPVTRELLSKAKQLKLIQNACLRHNAIDVNAARDAGIPVAALVSPTDVSVAEHALMLMMALGKKLLLADRIARSGAGRSQLAPYATSPGLSPLYKKTLGIVGLGEIGSLVARRAQAFDMKVVYYNRRRYPQQEELGLGVQYRELDDLMAESDIVDIHLAGAPETVNLIGAREIAAMKTTSFLVNTSRGAVVDEAALVEALSAGRISGAGLDVFTNEPLRSDHPLASLENVILTPHVAARGVVWDSLRVTFENIHRLMRNEPLEGII